MYVDSFSTNRIENAENIVQMLNFETQNYLENYYLEKISGSVSLWSILIIKKSTMTEINFSIIQISISFYYL